MVVVEALWQWHTLIVINSCWIICTQGMLELDYPHYWYRKVNKCIFGCEDDLCVYKASMYT